MLQPQIHQRSVTNRLVGVVLFTLLTIVAARVRLEVGPVPFTMQTFAVLLAGLVLGSRDGALSQVAYLSLLLLNLPVDTRMLGIAAFAGPTAGFLVGFPIAAYVSGLIVERGEARILLRWLAGVAGVIALFAVGVSWFAIYSQTGLFESWLTVGAPFVLPDVFKALLAAAVTEGGRRIIQ